MCFFPAVAIRRRRAATGISPEGNTSSTRTTPARALLDLKNAAGVSPENAAVCYQLGIAYQKTEDVRSAAAPFQKALAIDPRHAAARLRLAEMDGRCQQPVDHPGGPDPAGEDPGRLYPSVDALDVLAISEIKLGKPEDVLRTLERSMEQFPWRVENFHPDGPNEIGPER